MLPLGLRLQLVQLCARRLRLQLQLRLRSLRLRLCCLRPPLNFLLHGERGRLLLHLRLRLRQHLPRLGLRLELGEGVRLLLRLLLRQRLRLLLLSRGATERGRVCRERRARLLLLPPLLRQLLLQVVVSLRGHSFRL